MCAKYSYGVWQRFAHQANTILRKQKFELCLGRLNSGRTLFDYFGLFRTYIHQNVTPPSSPQKMPLSPCFCAFRGGPRPAFACAARTAAPACAWTWTWGKIRHFLLFVIYSRERLASGSFRFFFVGAPWLG